MSDTIDKCLEVAEQKFDERICALGGTPDLSAAQFARVVALIAANAERVASAVTEVARTIRGEWQQSRTETARTLSGSPALSLNGRCGGCRDLSHFHAFAGDCQYAPGRSRQLGGSES